MIPAMMDDESEKPKKRKLPRKVTPRSLENAALHYLERFATSSENLRRVLARRVDKSCYHHKEIDREEALGWVADLIERYQRSGLLNDKAYAEARVAGLNRRGTATRMIRLKLMEKGVGEDDIHDAFEALHQDSDDPELAAALNLARKRRIGPYRVTGDREGRREKDLAAMARSGFSYDMALKVIDADEDDLAELEMIAEKR